MGQNPSAVSPLIQKPIHTHQPKQIITLANLLKQKKIEELSPSSRNSSIKNQARLHSFGMGQYIIKCNKPFNDVKDINGYVQIYLLESHGNNQERKQIFQGQLAHGVRENFGVQFDKNGRTFYQGTFKNNKYHGWGVTQNYQGEWIDGMKQGWGIYINNQTKSKYQGFWNADKFHGMGAFNVQSNDIQNFLKGQNLNNSIIFQQMYVGEWSEGNMHGCGKRIKKTQKSIQTYEGQFSNGVYDGQGKLIIANQPIKSGTFKNGKFIQ